MQDALTQMKILRESMQRIQDDRYSYGGEDDSEENEYNLTKDDYEAIGPGVYLSQDYEVQILGSNDEGYNPKYDPDNNGEVGSLLNRHIMELEDRGSSRGMVDHFDLPEHYAEVSKLTGDEFGEDSTVGEVMNAIWGLWELQVGASVPEDFWFDE